MSATKKSGKSKAALQERTQDSAPVASKVVEEAEELVESPEEAAFRNRETMHTVIVLLFFSALMFSMPFAAFFGVRHYLGVHLGIYGFANTCWSVLSAVLTANIIVVAYVYIAYRDNQKEIARNKLKAN